MIAWALAVIILFILLAGALDSFFPNKSVTSTGDKT